jgi:tetratricopeptide (TPR) repeat protein
MLCAAERDLNAAERHVLKQTRDALAINNPRAALDHLQKWSSLPHSAQFLLQGHAYRMLEQYNSASEAYLQCLALNQELEAAGLSLINCYVELERWQDCKALLEQWVDVDTCDISLIYVTIRCAEALQDQRWSQNLIQVGLRRFPTDRNIRLFDLEHLINAERWREALQACTYLLKENPEDAKLWQFTAQVYRHLNQEALALAAIERAVLLQPQNQALRIAHIQAQLAAGHAQEAYKHAQKLLLNSPDHKAMTLMVRAAWEAGAFKTAETWLQKIPMEQRTENIHVLHLRILYNNKRFDAYDKQANVLLAGNLINPQTTLWVARVAEERTQIARAEMLYEMLRKQTSDTQTAQLATLYLARLKYSQGRKQEALELMKQHLKQYPQDEHAQRLYQLMD